MTVIGDHPGRCWNTIRMARYIGLIREGGGVIKFLREGKSERERVWNMYMYNHDGQTCITSSSVVTNIHSFLILLFI